MKEHHYRGRFGDLDGQDYELVITYPVDDSQANGLSVEVDLSATPIVLSYDSEDKLGGIVQSKAKVALWSDTDSKYQHLYTCKGRDVRLCLWRVDERGNRLGLYWFGTLDPETYQEPYNTKEGYMVELGFSDFSPLKRVKFPYNRLMSLEAVVGACLEQLALPTLEESGVRLGVRYLTSYFTNKGAEQRPSVQGVQESLPLERVAYVDTKLFFERKTDTSEDHQERTTLEAQTCWDVLEGVLRSFSLRLEQRAGVAYVYDTDALLRLPAEQLSVRGADAMLMAERTYNDVELTTKQETDKSEVVAELPPVEGEWQSVPRNDIDGYIAYDYRLSEPIYEPTGARHIEVRTQTAGQSFRALALFIAPQARQVFGAYAMAVKVPRPSFFEWSFESQKYYTINEGDAPSPYYSDLRTSKQVLDYDQTGINTIAWRMLHDRGKKETFLLFEGYDEHRLRHVAPLNDIASEHHYARNAFNSLRKEAWQPQALQRTELDVRGIDEGTYHWYLSLEAFWALGTSLAQKRHPNKHSLNLRQANELGLAPKALAQMFPGVTVSGYDRRAYGEPYHKSEDEKQLTEIDKHWQVRYMLLFANVYLVNEQGETTHRLIQRMSDNDRSDTEAFYHWLEPSVSLGERDYPWIAIQFGKDRLSERSWTKPQERLSLRDREDTIDVLQKGLLLPLPPKGISGRIVVELSQHVDMDFIVPKTKDKALERTLDVTMKIALREGATYPNYVLVRELKCGFVRTDGRKLESKDLKYRAIINPEAKETLTQELVVTTDKGAEDYSPARLRLADGSPLAPELGLYSGGSVQASLESWLLTFSGGQMHYGTLAELWAKNALRAYGTRAIQIEGTFGTISQLAPIHYVDKTYIRLSEELDVRASRSQMTLSQIGQDFPQLQTQTLTLASNDISELETRLNLLRYYAEVQAYKDREESRRIAEALRYETENKIEEALSQARVSPEDRTEIANSIKQEFGTRLGGIEHQQSESQKALERIVKSIDELKTSGVPPAEVDRIRTAIVSEVLGQINATIAQMQAQVDGEVSNWFLAGAPSDASEPTSLWTSNAQRDRHLGDTYTSTDLTGDYVGLSWRFVKLPSGHYQWVQIADTQVSKALQLATQAKSTADGKNTTYLSRPSAGYQGGDTWLVSEGDGEVALTIDGKRQVFTQGAKLYAKRSNTAFDWNDWTPDSATLTLPDALLSLDLAKSDLERIKLLQTKQGDKLTSVQTDASEALGRSYMQRLAIDKIRKSLTTTTEQVAQNSEQARLALEQAQRAKATALALDKLAKALAGGLLSPSAIEKVVQSGTTTTVGGLTLQDVLALKDENEQVRAYLDGSPERSVAFAAGVSHFASLDGRPEERIVEIRHDGQARFGLMSINQAPEGSTAVFHNPNNPQQPLLVVGGYQTPLAKLIDDSQRITTISLPNDSLEVWQNTEVNSGAQNNVFAQAVERSTQSIHIPRKGSVRLRAKLSLDLRINAPFTSYPVARGYVEVHLGGGVVRTTEFVRNVDPYDPTRLKPYDPTTTIELDETIDNLAQGDYYLEVGAYLGTFLQKPSAKKHTSANLLVEVRELSAEFVSVNEAVREVVFGSEGLSAFFGANRFVYLSQRPSEPVLSVRGRTDLPGLLLAGEVDVHTDKYHAWQKKQWGIFATGNEAYYSTAWDDKDKTNKENVILNVRHGIPHDQYTVQLTPMAPHVVGDALIVREVRAYEFSVELRSLDQRLQWLVGKRFAFACYGPNSLA